MGEQRKVETAHIAAVAERSASKGQIDTSPGLPLISKWSQLDGVDPLPPRIVWEKDGKEMALIPAGVFTMGITEDEAREIASRWEIDERWTLAETPQREMTLAAYYIDLTPVTQAEYGRFLKDNPEHRVPCVDEPWAGPFNWKEDRRQPPQGLEQHPVVLVSWYDALAYARWSGKVLPSEEQWEKAARGTDGRHYPWGDMWDATRLNSGERIAGRDFENIGDMHRWFDGLDTSKQAYTTAVNAYPAGESPYGLLDMAGNVWEWTASWFQAYPGSVAKHDDFGEKCRVMRGGSWACSAFSIRSSFRRMNLPEFIDTNRGFRLSSKPF